MAVLQWSLAAVVLTVSSIASGRLTVCPVNKLQFLSYNTSLLPLTNVIASSQDDVSNPLEHFVKQNAEPWCSGFNGAYDPNLHINFTFTEPVIITFLQSSGYFNAFVDSFSIQYALGAQGVFFHYGVIETPQIFNVDHSVNTLQEAYFSLERPLVAQKLKLNIRHSVFESSNRSCWNLKVLGCTFKQAMTTEEDYEPDYVSPEPCLLTSEGGMMIMNTAYPEPTNMPEPCTGSDSASSDSGVTTEQMLTVVVPVVVFAIVLCSVIMGIGVLLCYIIVARKSQDEGSSKFPDGVKVKILGRKHIPVPKEPGNEQKPFVGTMSTKRGSLCSNDSGSFHYDMPRPIMYDVPRTPSQRQRAGTISSNEYRNPIYDGASNKESNTYESIPYDLERTSERSRAASDSLPPAENRMRRASDMLPCSDTGSCGGSASLDQAMHSSEPQMVQYSVVDKSKKAKEALPVFEVLYDQSASKDDIDKPANLSTT